MIVQKIIELVLNLLSSLFSNINMPSLPFDLITPLAEFGSVGMWVLGKDLFLMMLASFGFWLVLKMTVGVVLWAYNLIAQIIP